MKPSTYLISLMMLSLLCACTETESAQRPTSADLILQIQNTDRLYTTEYVIHKIVTYDDVVKLRGSILSHDFDVALPQGKRKVIIPMEAHLKAYIDFKGFGESNVYYGADSTVVISLPDPQVTLTSTRIDNAGIKTYVDPGRSRFSQADLAEYERQGREAIINTIPDLDIVEVARADAYRLIVPMVEAMGYPRDKITVSFRTDLKPTDYLSTIMQTLKD